jgi:hypothetical protein
MNIKSLEERNWIRIDKTYPEQMALRKKILAEKLSETFVTITKPSTELAKLETLQLLIDYLPKRYPKLFQSTPDGGIINLFTGERFNPKDSKEDPLIIASKLVQEDWCILEWNPQAKIYQLTAGIVLFPMRWSVKEKFLQNLPDIHIPVPAFSKHLKTNVNDLFEDLNPENPVWRANWSLFHNLEGPLDLYLPPFPPGVDNPNNHVFQSTNLEEIGKQLTLRVEFQTLRRLPKSNAILFGIRTYQRYLNEFQSLPKSDTLALKKAIENINPDMFMYKSANCWYDSALFYLQSILNSKASL